MPSAPKVPAVTAESAPAEVTYLSVKYPNLKVLVKRGLDKGLPSVFAQFAGGAFTTSDPDVIAKLDTIDGIVRDTGVRYKCPTCGWTTRHVKLFGSHLISH